MSFGVTLGFPCDNARILERSVIANASHLHFHRRTRCLLHATFGKPSLMRDIPDRQLEKKEAQSLPASRLSYRSMKVFLAIGPTKSHMGTPLIRVIFYPIPPNCLPSPMRRELTADTYDNILLLVSALQVQSSWKSRGSLIFKQIRLATIICEVFAKTTEYQLSAIRLCCASRKAHAPRCELTQPLPLWPLRGRLQPRCKARSCHISMLHANTISKTTNKLRQHEH
ncbi:hypothetical protein F5B20DRAFT_206194 [Whalleya microplaca]|nr:hypothetical protein F5B20DRAFT_206194 [Whalleya microplaca]